MSPPPAATVAGRRPAAPSRSRAKSRPARPAQPTRPARPARPTQRAAHGGRAHAARAVALPRVTVPRLPRLPRVSLRAIPAALPAGGLFQGRRAIAVLGVLLLGLVFLQVSLLKLNTGISVNVERAAQLERDNAQARATVSKLDAGRRIEDAAGKLGMVMPAAGSICFLTAGRPGPCSGGDAAQAGAGLDPAADVAPLAGAAQGAATAAPAGSAPAGTTTPATTGAPTQTGAAPAAQTTAPAQATAPAQTGVATPAAGQAPATATAPAAATTPDDADRGRHRRSRGRGLIR